MRRAHFLSYAAAVLVASPISAMAQTASAPAPSPNAVSDDNDIVITARRREERLSDIPTAASVIDAAALADRGGALTSGELLANQPSIRFNNLSSSLTSEISIRASSTARGTTGDPSIGLYRNGSYVGGGGSGGRNFSIIDMLDVGRVEVLRGTQGALYGRNAVGGAVNIISAEPEFDFSGYVSARYQFDLNGIQAQGAINVPLADGVALRFSGQVIDQNKGFFFNPVNDVYFDRTKGHALRGQLRIERGPVDFIVLAETQRMTVPTISYQAYIPAGTPGYPGGYIQDKFRYPWSTAPNATQDVDGLQGIIRVHLGNIEIDSTTLFRKRRSNYALDSDAMNATELARARAAGQISATNPIDPNSAAYVGDQTNTFSQDVHATGRGGRLTWLIGGDVLLLDSDYSIKALRTPTTANPSPGTVAPAKLNFESYAAYGSLGYDLTERLNFTGELRFTHDIRSVSARLYDLQTGLPSGGATRVVDGEISADNLSYNATLSYKITPDILAYGKVGTSYRAGGFNSRLSDPRAPNPAQVLFGNENSTTYEAGVKGKPAKRGYFAIAAYYTRLGNLIAQVSDGCNLANAACPVAAVNYLTNAGNAKSWGVELEYNQGFDLGTGTGRLSLAGSRQGGKVTSGSYAGLPLAQVPDWLASANLDLRYPVASDVSLTGNVLVTGQWGGKQELTAATVDLDNYLLVNLRLGVEFRGFSVTAFANNLTNRIYFLAQTATVNRYAEPRVFGVETRVKF
jgi:iron complex outermembrane receptor protein